LQRRLRNKIEAALRLTEEENDMIAAFFA
jgi:hypothetical protein